MAEKALDVLRKAIPKPTTDELVEAIESAGNMLLSYGITSVMDAAVGHVAGFDEIRAYNLAKLQKRLPVRLAGGAGRPEHLDRGAMLEAGLVSGAGDDMLTIGAVNIFL